MNRIYNMADTKADDNSGIIPIDSIDSIVIDPELFKPLDAELDQTSSVQPGEQSTSTVQPGEQSASSVQPGEQPGEQSASSVQPGGKSQSKRSRKQRRLRKQRRSRKQKQSRKQRR